MIKNGTFKIPNPGMNYKDGKLFSFMKDHILVMKIDEHGPRAWKKTEDEPYFKVAHIPEHAGSAAARTIVNPPPEDQYIHWCLKAEMEFLKANVDFPIIEQMAKFKQDAFQICGLAMRTRGGLELVQSNPALAYIVALNNVFIGKCKKPWRRARNLVDRKRKIILEKAGFEGSQSVVKILSKLHPGMINKKSIFALRWLLRSGDDDILKPLRFLPNINTDVLDILMSDSKRALIGYPLLEELSRNKDNWIQSRHRSFMLHDTIRMSNMLNVQLPRNIRTLDQLDQLHDDLTYNLINSDVVEAMKYHSFVAPKLNDFHSGACHIEYIQNTHELQEWGKKQHNCVLSYNEELADGEIHIFRIKTRNEEATLSLIPEYEAGECNYHIDQLLSRCNKEVRPETRRLVDLWMYPPRNYTKQWDCFPMPEVKNEKLIIRPLSNLEFICSLPFDEFSCLSLEDVQENKVCFYQMQKPESGIIGLMKVHGQWDTVLVRDVAGNDMQLSTLNVIEKWLWENTPKGEARQLKFDFNKQLVMEEPFSLARFESKGFAADLDQLVNNLTGHFAEAL